MEAESQPEAVKKAQEEVDLYSLLNRDFCDCEPDHEGPCDHGQHVEHIEWAEEVTEALVDEVGDREYRRSAWYDAGGNPKPLEV